MSNASFKSLALRGPGRPRRLTLKAVIEAASELGLEHLSMSAVALRLGVGIATLYTYVKSLEELQRLVAVDRAWRPHLTDVGQHWSDIVRAHVKALCGMFCSDPQLMIQLIAGGLGPEDEINEIEAFLKLLTARGFSASEAFGLYRSASQIAFGAAAGGARTRNLNARGERRHVVLARALAEREPEDVPYLRSLGSEYTEEDTYSVYDDALNALLTQVAASRGEKLPSAPKAPNPRRQRKSI